MTTAVLIWDWLSGAGRAVIFVSLVIVAFGVIWAKAVVPVVHGLKEIAHQNKEQNSRLDVIEKRTKQLEPNGGSSIYDRVGALEAGHVDLAKGQAELVSALGKLQAMATAIRKLSGPRDPDSRTRATDPKPRHR